MIQIFPTQIYKCLALFQQFVALFCMKHYSKIILQAQNFPTNVLFDELLTDEHAPPTAHLSLRANDTMGLSMRTRAVVDTQCGI